MTPVDFAATDVAHRLEGLTPAEIDELPFGVVRLTADGVVVLYSKTEAKLSGFGERRAVGRDFFRTIAPCMNTNGLLTRLEREAQQGVVDFEFGQTGDFADPSRFIRGRLCSAATGGLWLLLQR
jgi:photoactive yellow protein